MSESPRKYVDYKSLEIHLVQAALEVKIYAVVSYLSF